MIHRKITNTPPSLPLSSPAMAIFLPGVTVIPVIITHGSPFTSIVGNLDTTFQRRPTVHKPYSYWNDIQRESVILSPW